MRVVVNGMEREVAEGMTGDELLASFHLSAATLVVELNGHVIKTTDFLDRAMLAGDSIELVTVVGGG